MRSDERPLAEERTAAARRRQEEINAADRTMTTTEAHPDQTQSCEEFSGTLNGRQTVTHVV